MDHEAGDLRVVPVDGEEDGGVAEDGEVERAVGVLPDVVAADDEVLAEALLESGMKLVPESRRDDVRSSLAVEQRRQNVIRAALTGQHEILVERRLQRAGIGDTKHGSGRFYAVGYAETRLRLPGDGKSVVEIPANADVEEPVAGLDLILDVERKLFDVRMAEVIEAGAAAG